MTSQRINQRYSHQCSLRLSHQVNRQLVPLLSRSIDHHMHHRINHLKDQVLYLLGLHQKVLQFSHLCSRLCDHLDDPSYIRLYNHQKFLPYNPSLGLHTNQVVNLVPFLQDNHHLNHPAILSPIHLPSHLINRHSFHLTNLHHGLLLCPLYNQVHSRRLIRQESLLLNLRSSQLSNHLVFHLTNLPINHCLNLPLYPPCSHLVDQLVNLPCFRQDKRRLNPPTFRLLLRLCNLHSNQ